MSPASSHQLDDDRLANYLSGVLEGFEGPLRSKKFDDGQSNPTYLLEAASGSYVLRRKPPGRLLKSAHAVDREFRVIQALSKTPVPVPTALHLCEDEDVIGSVFYLMSFEDGRIFWNPMLGELSKSERSAVYKAMNDVLIAKHRLDISALGLSDFGRSGNYYERQISRWHKQYLASQTKDLASMNRLIDFLTQNIPPSDDRAYLIHGDYRLDNMIFCPKKPKLLALIDWELATLGDAYADISYQCMQWRLPNGSGIRGLAGVDRKAWGIPSEEDYLGRFCDALGIAIPEHWNFYLAFNFFRLAAIIQGVYRRSLGGNASNAKAHRMGEFAKLVADMGAQQLD